MQSGCFITRVCDGAVERWFVDFTVTQSFVFPHSELFEVNHIRTIYHMFIALLILFILSTLVVDFIDEGR